MDTFTLTLQLGNEAMQTPGDVGQLLAVLGDELDAHSDGTWDTVTTTPLRDLNGNTVGRWEVS